MKKLHHILLGLACAVATTAGAQGFPNKPLRIINPYPTGGVIDVQLRVIAERMSSELGQPVLVESKPGGNANIGAEFVARAPADGYTLLATTTFIASNPVVESGLRWAPKDLQPVAAFGQTHNFLVVPEALPAKTVKEFLELARHARPALQVASNPGTSMEPAMQALRKAGGVTLEPVYYKGGPPAAMDLANGLLSASILPASVVHPYIAAGKIRPLAAFGSVRSTQYPNVPTIAEAGFPDAAAITWFGIHVPAGTPAEIVKRLDTSIRMALDNTAVKERIATSGGIANYMNTADFTSFLRAETRRWEELGKASK